MKSQWYVSSPQPRLGRPLGLMAAVSPLGSETPDAGPPSHANVVVAALSVPVWVGSARAGTTRRAESTAATAPAVMSLFLSTRMVVLKRTRAGETGANCAGSSKAP